MWFYVHVKYILTCYIYCITFRKSWFKTMNSVLIATAAAARSRKFIHPSGYMKVNNYSMMFHCAKHQKTCPGIY